MKVGDIVFLKKVNNYARGISNTEDLIIETKISKIGKKYFYVEYSDRYKFSFEDMTDVSEYCACYQVYINKQDIYDEIEINELRRKLKNRFDWTTRIKEDLNILRQVCEILKI